MCQDLLIFGTLKIETADGAVDCGQPLPPKFKRGDSDGDGPLTVGDPITSLSYQCLGTVLPACLDALFGQQELTKLGALPLDATKSKRFLKECYYHIRDRDSSARRVNL
jgi:hypothetical protein